MLDLAELLHAFAGLAGDQCRLVGSVTSIAHRTLDLGDHRLQLIEEAIEGERQAAQLVAAGVGEATGEVTFAFGDVRYFDVFRVLLLSGCLLKTLTKHVDMRFFLLCSNGCYRKPSSKVWAGADLDWVIVLKKMR